MHIIRRTKLSFLGSLLIRIIFIILALIVSALVIYSIVKTNPLKVYVSMINGAFGTPKRTWVTIRDLMMLTCLAVALAPAYTLKFWNIGAEGQMLMGCIGAAFAMINFKDMPFFVLIILMALFAIILGGLWGVIPSIFKVKWNINETIFTLMMNYIAIRFVAFSVAKWENPPGSNTVGIINFTTHNGWIPNLFKKGFNSDFAILAIIVILICILVYFYLRYTKHGFEIAVIGDSVRTAKYSGIKVNLVLIRTMIISGALCGLAGFLEVAAVSHTITTGSAGGRGFTAIIVAWLAKMNPFVMLVISAIISILDRGAVEIASSFGLNEHVSEIVTGIILFFILASEFFVRYKIVRGGKND